MKVSASKSSKAYDDTYLTVALGWLEYCNSTRDSYYANLRRKHLGHDKPYNVSSFTQSQIIMNHLTPLPGKILGSR
jgi:hypothetical protein